MRLFDIIRGRQKVSAQYRRDGSFVSRWARPPSLNTAEWLNMFSKSPRLAVVERIASDLANLNGHLYRIAPDGSKTEVTKHPFLDLMEHPNPLYEMTSSAMWRLNEIYLMLVGESFMLVERDEYERPVELWNVPPHWVKMTPYLGNPGYLITSPSGLTMTVSVDDMFVMKQLNPLDPFMRGLGVAESVADEVEIDEYAAKFQKVVTVNGVEFTLQSVTFSWYSNLTDLFINPASGRKNTAKYADALFKGCVTAPVEVAKRGLAYFDDQEDISTPSQLVREIENFLAERNKPGKSEEKSAT